jgi:dihydroxy-acid dehydratase
VNLIHKGFIIGHIAPEAQVGGPIALIKNGDVISIDAEKRSIQVEISEAEMETRRQQWTAPAYRAKSGTLYKFVKSVNSASLGCTTDQ